MNKYKKHYSLLKIKRKGNWGYDPEKHMPPLAILKKVLIFIKTIIERGHMCSEEEALIIVHYWRIVYMYHNKYEDFNTHTQICMLWRDLCLFYKEYKYII